MLKSKTHTLQSSAEKDNGFYSDIDHAEIRTKNDVTYV